MKHVGLLGGSFDPPHEGHVHITKQAIKAFNLSKIWWLVSPSNPLKERKPEDSLKRFKASKKIMQHPSVTISNIESSLKSRFTAETIYKLQLIYPRTKFVWLMGADNLKKFHYWNNWKKIPNLAKIVVFARQNYYIKSIATKKLSKKDWVYINSKKVNISSTLIRKFW